MRLPTAFFIFGVVFYAVAEITPINDVVALLEIQDSGVVTNPVANIPLGSFAYYTDFAKPFFMMSAILALGFFSLAFAYMEFKPLHRAAVNFVAIWSVILAIPDIIWPFGTPYYEVLKYYFGELSLILVFVLSFMMVSWRILEK